MLVSERCVRGVLRVGRTWCCAVTVAGIAEQPRNAWELRGSPSALLFFLVMLTVRVGSSLSCSCDVPLLPAMVRVDPSL